MSQDHHYLQEHSDEVAPTYLDLQNAEPSQEDHNSSYHFLQDDSNEEPQTSTVLQNDEPSQEASSEAEEHISSEDFSLFGEPVMVCLDAKASASGLGAFASTAKEKSR